MDAARERSWRTELMLQLHNRLAGAIDESLESSKQERGLQ